MKSLVKKRWQKEKSDVPLYQQVARFIAAAIDNGELPLNYVLPGHRQLATMFGVGIQTILHALQILHQSQQVKLSERSRTVVSKKPANSPSWDAFIGKSAYDPTNRNFFSIIDSHKESLNLSMGLDKEYYFRDMFNAVLKHISLPEDMAVHPFGLPSLRKEISTFMQQEGVKTNASEVMIVTSITHALNVLFLALLGKNSTLLVTKPCHLQISKLVKTIGSSVVEVPMDQHGINPYKLTQAIADSRQPILCLAPDCNIPTGIVTSGKRREEILSLCSKLGTPIIEYTVFPLGCTQSKLPSLKSLDTTQTVIHVSQIGVNTSTNPWLGWIIAEEYLLQRLNTLRFNYDAHQNYLTQMALNEVMQRKMFSYYLQRLDKIRVERQAAVNRLLDKYLAPYASWNHDNIDACVWLKFKKNINTRKLYEDAVDITFQPGWFYGDQLSNHIYLSPLTTSNENFEYGLKTIVELINKQLD